MACNCDELKAILEQIKAGLIDPNDVVFKENFLQLVQQYKDDIVSIIITSNSWPEINQNVNLSDYIDTD